MIYEPRPRPLSAALAAMPDLRNRLLADHVPDASGHRCRAGTPPGTGTPLVAGAAGADAVAHPDGQA